jgi:hypothetical protein
MKKKTTQPKQIPADKQEAFDALVDKLMDSGRLSGDEAVKKAKEQLGLAEGFKRRLRQAAAGNLEAAEKGIMKAKFRQAEMVVNRDERRAYAEAEGISDPLSPEDKKAENFSIRSLGFNAQKLALAAVPNSPDPRFAAQRVMSNIDRQEMKDLGKKVFNKVTASRHAENIYNSQPVVAKANREEGLRGLEIHIKTVEQKERREEKALEKEIMRKLGFMESLVQLSRRGLL